MLALYLSYGEIMEIVKDQEALPVRIAYKYPNCVLCEYTNANEDEVYFKHKDDDIKTVVHKNNGNIQIYITKKVKRRKAKSASIKEDNATWENQQESTD